MNFYFLHKSAIGDLIKNINKRYNVFGPVELSGLSKSIDRDAKVTGFLWQKIDSADDNIVIAGLRAAGPLKQFFFFSKERVSQYAKAGIAGSDLPLALIGVKACDLAAFGILDYVFLKEPFSDPFYSEKRKSSLIISADCACVQDTCFCTALGRRPYPQSFFDINLSELEDGFIVEIGSDKGKAVVEDAKSIFSEISEDDKNKRNKGREMAVFQVEKNIERYKIPHCRNYKAIIKDCFNDQLWKDEASNCVECGACNFICPTCHCFQLGDVLIDEQNERFKIWDACLYKRFAEVAGGGNPRPNLWMRLRNRYDKKFDYFPEVSGEYACTGCGRCILCCPAKIDIRRILKNLVAKSAATHPA